MKILLSAMLCGIVLSACSKTDLLPQKATEEFIEYIIPAGNHYSDKSSIRAISLSKQNFEVKFNSTAVYTNADPENQYDINKLYGFTEGTNPHFNSARIGWAFNDDSLRLYAYAYANGERFSKEMCAVTIGETIRCAIKVDGKNYIFSVNDVNVSLDRGPVSSKASGYQLYPYFGGDEPAPHAINIYIREAEQGSLSF